jgi:hypothetical protein
MILQSKQSAIAEISFVFGRDEQDVIGQLPRSGLVCEKDAPDIEATGF